MDSILFANEFVQYKTADIGASPWSDFLDKNPTVEKAFRGGKGRPVFIDLLMADKEFKPFHKDTPDKNGKKYKLTRAALQKAVDDGEFGSLPVLLNKLSEKSHGFGSKDRKVIGTTHGAVLIEDERGPVVQVLAQVWDSEIPKEFKDIESKKDEVGASAEFSVGHMIDEQDISVIEEFTPTGALLLEKDKAAFKETALYCSDSETGGEPEPEQHRGKEVKDCDKPKPQRGRKNMDFCENCAPLAKKVESEAKAAVEEKFKEELQKYSELTTKLNETKLAAADAESAKETLEKQNQELTEKIAQMEKEQKETLAAAEATREFEARKDRYPVDKHDELKRIFLRLKLGQSTPEDALNLADWQTPSEDKGKKPDKGTSLSLAGADEEKPEFEYKPRSNEELDAIMAKYGVRGEGGK